MTIRVLVALVWAVLALDTTLLCRWMLWPTMALMYYWCRTYERLHFSASATAPSDVGSSRAA